MRRHDLVTLKPNAVLQSVVCCTTDSAAHYVKQWIAEERAFVCPRQNPQSEMLQLGVAFVANGVKHRAFVRVRYEDMLRVDNPHRLLDCMDLFSQTESLVLQQLDADLNDAGIIPYVFGSVAWEKISGKSYRTAKSDLDLLCDVETINDVRFVATAFAAIEDTLPFRIDGELRFPNDDCANWREVLAALEHYEEIEILVKGEAGVRLSHLDSLLELSYA